MKKFLKAMTASLAVVAFSVMQARADLPAAVGTTLDSLEADVTSLIGLVIATLAVVILGLFGIVGLIFAYRRVKSLIGR